MNNTSHNQAIFRKRNLAILLFIGFFNYLSLLSPVPLFIEMILDPDNLFLGKESSLHMRGLLLGILTAIPPCAQALLSPYIGALSDRRGRKYVITLSLLFLTFGNAIGFVAIYFQSLLALFINRFCLGICLANTPVLQASISDITYGQERKDFFGYMNLMFGIGSALGPSIGAIALTWFDEKIPGYLLLYIINIVLALLSLCVIFFLKMSAPQGAAPKKGGALPKRISLFLLSMFSCCFGWCIWNEFIAVYYKETMSLSTKGIGIFLSYRGLCLGIGSAFLIPLLTRKFSLESILRWSICAQAIATISSLWVSSIPTLAFHTLFSLSCNAVWMTLAIVFIAENSSEESQGKAQGAYMSLYAAASSTSSIAFGPLASTHPELCPTLSGLFILISFIVFRYLIPSYAKEPT